MSVLSMGSYKSSSTYKPSTFKAPSSTYKASTSSYKASTSSYKASTSTYKASTSSYKAPTSTYKASTSTYKAPASTYKASTSTYKAPTSTYKTSTNTYKAPASTYKAPASTYKAPTSTYKTPSSSYTVSKSGSSTSKSSYKAPTKSTYIATTSTYKVPVSSYVATLIKTTTSKSSYTAPTKSTYTATATATKASTYKAPTISTVATKLSSSAAKSSYTPTKSTYTSTTSTYKVPTSSYSSTKSGSSTSKSSYTAPTKTIVTSKSGGSTKASYVAPTKTTVTSKSGSLTTKASYVATTTSSSTTITNYATPSQKTYSTNGSSVVAKGGSSTPVNKITNISGTLKNEKTTITGTGSYADFKKLDYDSTAVNMANFRQLDKLVSKTDTGIPTLMQTIEVLQEQARPEHMLENTISFFKGVGTEAVKTVKDALNYTPEGIIFNGVNSVLNWDDTINNEKAKAQNLYNLLSNNTKISNIPGTPLPIVTLNDQAINNIANSLTDTYNNIKLELYTNPDKLYEVEGKVAFDIASIVVGDEIVGTSTLSTKIEKLANITNKADKVEIAIKGGTYSNIIDGPSVGSGKNFTKMQKDKIITQNMEKNGGVVKSDLSGETLVKPQKSSKGVTPDPKEWQIDHIDPKSKGGSNSYSNAQVLSRIENRLKSDK